MEDTPKNEKKTASLVPIRPTRAANISQRKAMHEILASDEEYSDMGSFFVLPLDTTNSIDADVQRETGVQNVSNVMNILYCDIQGYSSRYICSKMDLTILELSRIRTSAAYIGVREALLREILATSRRIMEVSAIKAVKTLAECMDSTNEKVKLAAATEVLDRIGLNTTQRVEITTTGDDMSNFTDDQLVEILRHNLPKSGVIEVDEFKVGDVDE